MLNWIIIIVLVIVGLYVLKINHLKHRFWIVLLLLIVLFLYISIIIVNKKYDLNADSTEGVFNSVKIYIGWLGNGFQNMKDLVGNAIKMDWTSSNKSLFDKTNSSIKNKSVK